MVEWLGKRYLNDKGYNYQWLVRLGAPAVSKPLASFTPEEWTQLEAAQRKAEWWKEWTVLPWTKKNNYTASQLNELAKISWDSVETLKGLSTDELNNLAAANVPNANMEIANRDAWKNIQSLYWVTAEDIADVLTMKAQGWTKVADYKKWLVENWKNPAFVDEAIKLNAPKSDITSWYQLINR